MMRLVPSTERSQDRGPRTVVITETPGAESLRLRALATSAGFRVVSASSGHMVQTVARRSAPDLVVLTPETGPPGPSEIARVLKESPETRDVPVLHVIESRRFDEIAPRAYPTEATLSDDASDEEILKTMRMLTARAPKVRYTKRTNAPLEGDLESDTFPEVLQFLLVTSKSGRVTVSHGRKEGTIYLESGSVVHAEIGEVRGLAAFRRMCFLQQGWFRFEPGIAPPRRTMWQEGMGLLLEAARQKDVSDLGKPPRSARSAATRVSKRPRSPELLTSVTTESDSRALGFGSAGVLLFVLALLLAAFGVFARGGL